MIKILKYGQTPNSEIFSRVSPKVDVQSIVSDIIEKVKADGDKAACAKGICGCDTRRIQIYLR